MKRGLEHEVCEKELTEQGLFHLKRSRLEVVVILNHLPSCYREEGARDTQ